MEKVRMTVVLLMILISASCKKENEAHDGMMSEIDYKMIEVRTNRTVIVVDSTKLDSLERVDFCEYQRKERCRFVEDVKLALDYELKEGFEIIHFLYDKEFDCHFVCPNIYAQLTSDEYYKLMKRLIKRSQRKTEDDVKDYEGKKFHRILICSSNGITAYLEGNERCCREDVFLQVDAYTKVITYHYHHHYWCQTNANKNYYERVWKYLQDKKQKCER